MRKGFSKFLFILSSTLVSTFLFLTPALPENITITTYYPAPFGVYKELRAEKITVDQIKITGGFPENGRVLTSDADGLASWQAGGGCNWNGWKCHCNADTTGDIEGHVILGEQCLNGVVNNFKIFEFQATVHNDSCPASYAGCDIYSRY